MWNYDANEAIELRNGSAVYAKQKKENRKVSLSLLFLYFALLIAEIFIRYDTLVIITLSFFCTLFLLNK